MTVSKDLFLSILSMDAYNRGYNPGIAGLSENGQIGHATIGLNSGLLQDENENRLDVPASFYGLASKLTQSVGTSGNLIADRTTIISYRGKYQVLGERPLLDLPVQKETRNGAAEGPFHVGFARKFFYRQPPHPAPPAQD